MHTRVVTFHSIPSPTQTSPSHCPATCLPYDMPTIFAEPHAYRFAHLPAQGRIATFGNDVTRSVRGACTVRRPLAIFCIQRAIPKPKDHDGTGPLSYIPISCHRFKNRADALPLPLR